MGDWADPLRPASLLAMKRDSEEASGSTCGCEVESLLRYEKLHGCKMLLLSALAAGVR